MGPRLKLPRHVHSFLDRHGKPRFYFRRPGFKNVPLRGLPYSREFMADYEAALASQPAPVGADRTRPGTMRALALSYLASPGFTALRPSTRHVYRLAIERFCRAHGDKRASELRHEHVVRLMGARAERPNAANALRILLRVLMRHARDRDARRRSHGRHPSCPRPQPGAPFLGGRRDLALRAVPSDRYSGEACAGAVAAHRAAPRRHNRPGATAHP